MSKVFIAHLAPQKQMFFSKNAECSSPVVPFIPRRSTAVRPPWPVLWPRIPSPPPAPGQSGGPSPLPDRRTRTRRTGSRCYMWGKKGWTYSDVKREKRKKYFVTLFLP